MRQVIHSHRYIEKCHLHQLFEGQPSLIKFHCETVNNLELEHNFHIGVHIKNPSGENCSLITRNQLHLSQHKPKKSFRMNDLSDSIILKY